MKLTILRNPGRDALKKLNTTDAIAKTLVEGATVDVSQSLADALIKLRLAEVQGVVRAVPERAEIGAVEPPAIRGDSGKPDDFKKLDEGRRKGN